MKPKFIKYPGQLLAIDLRGIQSPISWTEVGVEAMTYAPFSFVLWICPSSIWADHQTDFIATIQSLRRHSGTGGRTGPTALVCPDFMALDWIGPVRAMAIPIYGNDISLFWSQKDGTEAQCNPLEPLPCPPEDTLFIRCTGRRPKVDLL